MSKGERKGSKPLIDLSAVMDNIPTIMGLNLKRKGENKWEGGYYMNRERHPYRRDKLKVTIWNYNIWVHEEGFCSMTLQRWLVEYLGAKDYKEAYRIMRGNSIPMPPIEIFNEKSNEIRYIPNEIFEDYKKYPLNNNNLYNYFCRLFGEEKTKECFDKYNVTSNEKNDVVFWYKNFDNKFIHDKVVRYQFSGRRDKGYGGYRRFQTASGYKERCLFGSHLIESNDEIINICESEKSAMMASIVYGGIWLASGGKNQLKDTDERTLLFPDLDAIEDWREKGNVVEWWENCGISLNEKADIGDLIDVKIKNGSLKV